MPKMTLKQLIARDSKRDLGTELLDAVRAMRAGRPARTHHVKVPELIEARTRTGLTLEQFAAILGASERSGLNYPLNWGICCNSAEAHGMRRTYD